MGDYTLIDSSISTYLWRLGHSILIEIPLYMSTLADQLLCLFY